MENRISAKPDHLLESTYDKVLEENEIRESRWKNYKEENEALISRLLSLRENLKYDIMVPIGKLALMKGKLVHTNEILVSLGDGWFGKKSAAEATEVCKRRMKECDKMLDKLKKERELLTSRKTFPMEHDIFSGNEIMEPYDEASEAEWREKHKERVRAHKLKEAKKRQNNKIKDEKDLFELLDALELKEEEEDELNRMVLSDINNDKEEEDEDDDEVEDDEEEEEEEDEDSDDDDRESECDEREDDEKEVKHITNCEISKSSKTAEINLHKEVESKVNLECEINDNNSINSSAVQNNKSNDSLKVRRGRLKNSEKVTFAEDTNSYSDEEIDPVIIYFKHSDILPEPCNENNSETQNVINSPADIYKTYVNNLSGVPKSILKKNATLSNNVINEVKFDKGEKEKLDDVRKKRSEANSQVKIGDITERSEVVTSTQSSSERPVSRFKASRQAVKKLN